MLPLRVLSRRNLAYPSRRSTSKPPCFSDLPTLDFSLRSFSHSDPLFSITSTLFLQNTRGGIPPVRPLRSRVLTIVLHDPIPSRFSLIPDSSSICFRINTCKSVSKQKTLTPFRINTYKKPGEGGIRLFRVSSVQPPVSNLQNHMRHVAPLSPVPSFDCAYFLSPRGCTIQSTEMAVALRGRPQRA